MGIWCRRREKEKVLKKNEKEKGTWISSSYLSAMPTMWTGRMTWSNAVHETSHSLPHRAWDVSPQKGWYAHGPFKNFRLYSLSSSLFSFPTPDLCAYWLIVWLSSFTTSQTSSSPFQGPNRADSVARYYCGSLHDPRLMSALLCMTGVDQSLTYCPLLYFPSSLCTFSYRCLHDAPKIYSTGQSLVWLFSYKYTDPPVSAILEVGTHSLPNMLVRNQLTCSSAKERRSHLL